MGHRPKAILFYGVIFEEGYEFPWSEEDEYEPEEWWQVHQRLVCGAGLRPEVAACRLLGLTMNPSDPLSAKLAAYWG